MSCNYVKCRSVCIAKKTVEYGVIIGLLCIKSFKFSLLSAYLIDANL